MKRYFIKLAYDGTPFSGWQIQPDAPTVQEFIEQALSKVVGNPTNVIGCGRTDAGVHASLFFAHFEADLRITCKDLVFKLNCMLPAEIAIFDIYEVDSEMHARFSATSRTYHYFINQVKDPFKVHTSWYNHSQLNVERMNEACGYLLGRQDFTSFSKLHTQTFTNLCTITEAKWVKEGHQLIFTITADRFLRNMVRAIVGTLIDVGLGKISPEGLKEIIAEKNRQKAGTSVPGKALFLSNITYP